MNDSALLTRDKTTDMRILIVDDEESFRNMLADGLDDACEVHQAASGSDAICKAAEVFPQIAIVDINMPDMSGYEVCQALKADLPELRVVCVSGDGALDKQIMAYEAGADDFMVKPFRVAELQLKMDLLKRVITEAKRLKSDMKSASDLAMLAIKNSGEMGGVINFIKRAGVCQDIESLLKALVTATASTFNLTLSAQITVNDEHKTLNSAGRSSPLEAEMLRCQARESDRIYTSGRRMMVNYPRVTLLIKDMPLDDPELCGRLRDHLAIMVEAAETRIDGILMEQRVREQQTVTLQTIASIQQVMGMLEHDYRKQEQDSRAVLDDLKAAVEDALIFLGLTENQENALMNLIGKSVDQATSVYSEGLALEDKFAVIINVLERLQNYEAKPEVRADEPDDSIILF